MGGRPYPCYIVDKVTGRIVSEHPAMVDAAKALGLTRNMSRQIVNRRLPEDSFYAIRRACDYDPRESFEDKRKGVPVYGVRDGELRVFRGIRAAAEELHYSRETVGQSITKGRETIDGWRFHRMKRMGELNGLLGLEDA